MKFILTCVYFVCFVRKRLFWLTMYIILNILFLFVELLFVLLALLIGCLSLIAWNFIVSKICYFFLLISYSLFTFCYEFQFCFQYTKFAKK